MCKYGVKKSSRERGEEGLSLLPNRVKRKGIKARGRGSLRLS